MEVKEEITTDGDSLLRDNYRLAVDTPRGHNLFDSSADWLKGDKDHNQPQCSDMSHAFRHFRSAWYYFAAENKQ
ncbi:hypothetical protein J6590_030966 [Homalodisca vitripennis]|nr:hypothetical protein J6590_030966 [Homalodisca vitripennis]